MGRRSLIVCCAGVVLLVAGCVSTPVPTDGTTTAERVPSSGSTIHVEEVTIEQGENATISIRATQVGEVWFATTPSVEGLSIEWNPWNGTFSPPPSMQVDTYPPYWTWEHVKANVRMEFPIRAAENTPPGRYTFELRVLNSTNHDHERAATATVTVHVVDGNEAPSA